MNRYTLLPLHLDLQLQLHTHLHIYTSTSTHVSIPTTYPNTIGNKAPAREEIPILVAIRTSRDSSSNERVLVDGIAVVNGW